MTFLINGNNSELSRLRSLFVLFQCVALGFLIFPSSSLKATVLPDNYGLVVSGKSRPIFDAELSNWLSLHMKVPALADLSNEKVDELVKSSDKVTAAYVRQYVNRDRGIKNDKLNKENLELALFEVEEQKKKQTESHPLLPYLIVELSEVPDIGEDLKTELNESLRRIAPESCPVKRSIIRGFTKSSLKEMTADEIQAKAADLQRFYSSRFRKQALESLLAAIPVERRQEVQPKLLVATKSYDDLLRKFSWLESEGKQSVSADKYASIRKLASKKQCKPAEKQFQGLIEAATVDESLNAIISAGTGIDRCLRARSGVSGGIQFWKDVLPEIQKKFGFRGSSSVELRIAVLEWTRENLSEAKSILVRLQESAIVEKDRFGEAKSLYTLAKIAEDEKDYVLASRLYVSYVERFADSENFEAAFMSVVTLLAMDKRWEEMLKPLNALITSEGELALDTRPTGLLSFAYFWAGRANFELSRPAMAYEMWRRVATEYYSTFYGALGHFLLEKNLQKTYALEPSRTSPFRSETLRIGFQGKDRAVFDRASALLKIGRKADASCEIAELDIADKGPERVLGKALLMHAAGDWLDAIKLFDGLPRSYRNSLPIGVERILFPRNYASEIVQYAERLHMDPDIIFALIRQESVYNPRAQSQVGALGLMQLMPATARLEAGRLGTGYLPAARRREISRAVGGAKGILEVENNIALGVHHFYRLLNKYKSPVFALSAYNASPGATEKWLKTIPSEDILVFIERIPYAETRAYVKLILRNYFYYKRWYDPAEVKGGRLGGKMDYRHLMAVASGLIDKSILKQIEEKDLRQSRKKDIANSEKKNIENTTNVVAGSESKSDEEESDEDSIIKEQSSSGSDSNTKDATRDSVVEIIKAAGSADTADSGGEASDASGK